MTKQEFKSVDGITRFVKNKPYTTLRFITKAHGEVAELTFNFPVRRWDNDLLYRLGLAWFVFKRSFRLIYKP